MEAGKQKEWLYIFICLQHIAIPSYINSGDLTNGLWHLLHLNGKNNMS